MILALKTEKPMKITFLARNGQRIFLAIAHDFEEQKLLETAGFEWHPGPFAGWHDRLSCDACAAGADIGHFTSVASVAVWFARYADEKAEAEFSAQEGLFPPIEVDLDEGASFDPNLNHRLQHQPNRFASIDSLSLTPEPTEDYHSLILRKNS
jgi:hypothetical protein